MSGERVSVLVAGAGPVGSTLAMDLGWRGLSCLVVEQTSGPPTNPRCNTTGARSMEHFRRLGVADRIRKHGLPPDAVTDVVYRTRRLTGHEIVRYKLPSAAFVLSGNNGAEGDVTPEPQHRIGQIFLEPILRDHAQTFDSVEVHQGTRLMGFEQTDDVVRATVENVSTGEQRILEADYLVGCDGGGSVVRRQLGIEFEAGAEISNNLSHYFRSPELGHAIEDPAWLAWSVNPEGISTLMAVDGRELWINHSVFPVGTATEREDPEQLLLRSLGRRIPFETLGIAHWTGNTCVAQSYRDRRVLLAGDAAHIWIPMAGFNMNSGIQDATSLSWMLAAVLEGWAGPELLDAYEPERRPIGAQVAQAARLIASGLFGAAGRELSERPGPEGAKFREDLAARIVRADKSQYNPIGLNFGYHYADSPIVWRDGAPPPLTVGHYEPTTTPGVRLPHFWRKPGVSIFDELGPYFTLIRAGVEAPEGLGLRRAADRLGVPLSVLHVTEPQATGLYGTQLLLVRPDQHIAWRGAHDPEQPEQIIQRVRGAAVRRRAESTAGGKNEIEEASI